MDTGEDTRMRLPRHLVRTLTGIFHFRQKVPLGEWHAALDYRRVPNKFCRACK